MNNFLKNNQSFIFALTLGILYFFFSWSLDFGDSTKALYMLLMTFLPGLTFPLFTCTIRLAEFSNFGFKILIHLLCSVAIYHASVWIYSAHGQFKFISLFAGFIGSFAFLLTSKLTILNSIKWLELLIISLLSGIGFIPCVLTTAISGFYLGIAIFIWHLLNGWLINLKIKSIK